MASWPGDTYTIRNLGTGTLTIGNLPDITVTSSRDYEFGNTTIQMSREIGGRLYREQLYIDDRHIMATDHSHFNDMINSRIQQFDYTTSAMTSSSYAHTHTYPPISPSYYDHISNTADSIFNTRVTWRVPDEWSIVNENGTWWFTDASIKPLTHHETMQQKINEAWDIYCRNENHPKKMQERIEREWWAHLEEEKIKEAERIRLLPEKKANELMSMLIGEKEQKVYEETGRVFVKGKNGLYMVKRGGGISKINGNKIIDFCVHIESHYKCPPTDHAIALKMMLEENDEKVIKLANRLSTRTVERLPLAACM